MQISKVDSNLKFRYKSSSYEVSEYQHTEQFLVVATNPSILASKSQLVQIRIPYKNFEIFEVIKGEKDKLSLNKI